MDDHRQSSAAEGGGPPAGPGIRGRLRNALRRAAAAAGPMFVPAAFSAFWAVVILAYGFGYLASGDRSVTVVELVFFVALLAGPVAMTWIGAWMLARSERLARASAVQAAAASELAAAVARMREVYDGAAGEIGGRLGDHLTRLERRIDDAAGALSAMVEAVTEEARETLAARSGDIAGALSRNAETVAGTLERQNAAIGAALEEIAATIHTALDGRVEEMRALLGTRTRDIDRALVTGAERLEKKLSETAVRVERALGGVADRAEATLGARGDAIAAGLADTEAGIRTALEHRVGELDDVLGRTAAALSGVLDTRAERVEAALDRVEAALSASLTERRDAMTRDLDALADAVAGVVVTRGEEIDQALAAQTEAVTASVGELTGTVEGATADIHKALAANAGELRQRLSASVREIGSTLAAGSADLAGALDGAGERMTAALEARLGAVDEALAAAGEGLRHGIGSEVGRLGAEIAQLRGEIAAHPPASAARLADLLGEGAAAMVAPERAAVTGALERLERVETQVRRLIYAAERAARLAPLTAAAAEPDPALPAPRAAAGAEGVALPFAEAIASDDDAPPPGWEVVLRALNFPDDEADREGSRALARARGNAQLGRLVGLAEAVLEQLAGEGVYMDDLEPNHARAADWAAFGADPGAHGGPVLAGIADEVALAVARGRIAGDAGFRETAMRLVQEWHRLVGRAVAAVGSDGLLVELADTRTGRAVMLMGRVTGAFPAPRAAAE